MATLTKAELIAKIVQTIYQNDNGEIEASKHQALLIDLVNSLINKSDDGSIVGLGNYQSDYNYTASKTTVKDGKIYQANKDTTGEFNPNDWDEIKIDKTRVVPPNTTLVVAKRAERHYAQNLYNKGTVVVEDDAPTNYGAGENVPNYAILRVDGLLINEGLIINNGLIITN